MGCSDTVSSVLRERDSWPRVSIEPWYITNLPILTSPLRTRKIFSLLLSVLVLDTIPGPILHRQLLRSRGATWRPRQCPRRGAMEYKSRYSLAKRHGANAAGKGRNN